MEKNTTIASGGVTAPAGCTIVMVDDDLSVLKTFYSFFMKKGCTIVPVKDPRHFPKKLKSSRPDIIFMDIDLGPVKGDSVIRALRKSGSKIPVFVVSGHIDDKLKSGLADLDIAGFYPKPVDMNGLHGAVTSIIRKKKPAAKKASPPRIPSSKAPVKKAPVKKTVAANTSKRSSAIILSENLNLHNTPDRVIPSEVIERHKLNIYPVKDLPTAVKVLKHPSSGIRLIMIDTAREGRVLSMIRLLAIIEKKTGRPVCFFGNRFNSSFKQTATKHGLSNFIKLTETPTKDTIATLDQLLGAKKGRGASTRINNLSGDLKAIKTMPPIPDIYFKVEKLSKDPRATSKDFASVLELDPAITARLIRMSNSAFYSFKRKIKSVKDTVTMMGTKEILSLVRLACITNAIKGNKDVDAAVRAVWEHSAACAIAARLIYHKAGLEVENDLEDELFISGIVHDLGKIILWNFFAEHYMTFMLHSGAGDYPTHEDERHYMGASHEDVGQVLAKHWNLPDTLKDVISFHHRPDRKPNSDVVAIIHIADAVTDLVLGVIPEGEEPHIESVVLERFGLTIEKVHKMSEEYGLEIQDSMSQIVNMLTGA